MHKSLSPLLLSLSILLISAVTFSACTPFSGTSPEPTTPSEEAKTDQSASMTSLDESAVVGTTLFAISPEEATITWTGRKHIGVEHTGTIGLESGQVFLNGESLAGALFVFDMTSITVNNEPAGVKQTLERHLNSTDFFDTVNHSKAYLKIESVSAGVEEAAYLAEGTLTIKGISAPIAFPFTATVTEGKIAADAQLSFNRATYDVRFGSESFFENLADDVIEDEVEISVSIAPADVAVVDETDV